MGNKALIYAVAFCIFIIALLFCHAFEVSNAYIYYPLAIAIGFTLSVKAIHYVSPTAFDPAPSPEPKTRQGKKKAIKEAQTFAKRIEKTAKVEAEASRKIAETRKRN